MREHVARPGPARAGVAASRVPPAPRPRRRPPGERWVAGAAAAVYALPLGVLVVQAFADEWRAPALLPQRLGLRGFEIAFGTGGAGEALATSLLVAAATTALALALGWPAARLVAERRRALLLTALALPLLVPPYATGTGLAEWFIRLGLADTLLGLVLAHLTVVLPYVVLVLASGFGSRLRDLEEMAHTVGLAPARRLALVTLPSLRPALALAALLGFLVSWSQYGSSLAVGGGRPTLPIVLLPFARADPQAAAALALLFLGPAVAALVLAARASRSPL